MSAQKRPTFDSDGYPTEETLEIIAKWENDYENLMEFVREAWRWKDDYFHLTIKDGERMHELHTGGWSGNESLMGALKQNQLFWVMCWQESRRGGHYKFIIRG